MRFLQVLVEYLTVITWLNSFPPIGLLSSADLICVFHKISYEIGMS